MAEALTREQRDALLARVWDLEARLYPPEDAPEPDARERERLREQYYQALAEYSDRLPRMVLSVCPFTGEPLRRALDPWGLDGPWWLKDRIFKVDEPAAPPTFRVLLGALALGNRAPAESRGPVIPGPEVPFVVPRLLRLPGMRAVVHRVPLETGDVAYPIAYFSTEAIDDRRLHQFWLRQDLWFKNAAGGTSWLIANDVWDFDLAPWVEQGLVGWVRPDLRVADRDSGEPFPYSDLPGDRAPQSIARGRRSLLPLPNGVMVDPFHQD